MKKYITLSLFLFVALFSNAQSLLKEPQKVVIDKAHNRYLISNFNGGDIVEIDSAGNHAYFVQAANFVDGLEIVGDTVFGVGHNRKVTAYNLTTKELVMDIRLEGSNSHYLSSITSDSAGHLFISCPALHTIYKLRISDGAHWIFAENNGLNRPNGILLEKENDRIVVIDDSPNTSIIHAISLIDSTVSDLMTNNFHNPDGITRDKYGYYYVGGYYLPGIYKINPDFSGEPELFFEHDYMVYPTYHDEHHSLLITYYWEKDWDEVFLTTTSLATNNLTTGPVLNQNYPNPFFDYTTISFDLNSNTHTSLEIYDVIGKKVNTLIDELRQAGSYSTSWDGTDSSGKQLPNGTYIFRLTVKGSVQTQSPI